MRARRLRTRAFDACDDEHTVCNLRAPPLLISNRARVCALCTTIGACAHVVRVSRARRRTTTTPPPPLPGMGVLINRLTIFYHSFLFLLLDAGVGARSTRPALAHRPRHRAADHHHRSCARITQRERPPLPPHSSKRLNCGLCADYQSAGLNPRARSPSCGRNAHTAARSTVYTAKHRIYNRTDSETTTATTTRVASARDSHLRGAER